MNDWWIVLTGLGFLALCVALDAWWLIGAHEYGDGNGTHP